MKSFRFALNRNALRALTLCALILTTSFSAFAKVIPMTRAKADAERFLKEAAHGRSPLLYLTFAGSRETKAGAAEPAYFVFNDARGGFVIAAGDDTVPFILGYSTSGSVREDSMPENLRGWLDMWSDIVEDARRTGAAPYPQAAPTTGGTSKLLETALWDQGDPFNRHCVEMEGERAVTGCTMTATAILMRYHQWPERGHGVVPSYVCRYKEQDYTIPSVELGHPYDWANMPLTNDADGSWSDQQVEEVSTLMSELGVMFRAEYSPEKTGAYLSYVGAGLAEYMDYDKSFRHEHKNLYPDLNDWIALMKDNIDKVGPVLYAGYSADSGHAFLLDGYDEQDNFHINWGWSGSYNGYFVMPDFLSFTLSQEAVLGLKPDAGGSFTEDVRIIYRGLQASVDDFAVGVPFSVSCMSVLNYGEETFAGETAFAKFDRQGGMDELVSEPRALSLESMSVDLLSEAPCVIHTPIKTGDVIQMVYRSPRTPSWTPVRYNHEDENLVGAIAVGDPVILEDIVSVSYDALTGILTVSFADKASCELRLGATAVHTGVSDQGNVVTIDARQLVPAEYTLHLQRGDQEKDITIKFGLKK